jgi:hypothetical protein
MRESGAFFVQTGTPRTDEIHVNQLLLTEPGQPGASLPDHPGAVWADVRRSQALLSFSADAVRRALTNQEPVSAEAGQVPAGAALTAGCLERWELLGALAGAVNGPPTAVQLDLLDHLAGACGGIASIQ